MNSLLVKSFKKSSSTPFSRSVVTLTPFASRFSTAAKGPVVDVPNSAEFKQQISSNNLVVVDFYATWCGPCVQAAPHFAKLASNTTSNATGPQVSFLKVDIDKVEDVARDCQISAVPTFQFFKGGKKVDEVVGANFNAIQQKLSQLTSAK
eukprot:TRINITY_DN1657_c0_g6_i1.p2 TRINITY_DN1657_c0_g6~~TRINITY_DN1657_c0_g6_i1.p2  ORF type:complete len:150 (+),score=37.31 TRINITY_DN1657_c0_g6_i1:79-528(+)